MKPFPLCGQGSNRCMSRAWTEHGQSPRVKQFSSSDGFPVQHPQCCCASLQPHSCCSWSPGSAPQTPPWHCQLQHSRAQGPLFLNPAPAFPALLCTVTSQTQSSPVPFRDLPNPQGERRSRGRLGTKPSTFHSIPGMLNPPQTLCPQFQPLCLAAAPAQDCTAVPRDSTHAAFFSNRGFLGLQLLHLC